MSKFIDRLQKISSMKESLVCIGLDPDPVKMPSPDVFEFCKTIVDSTQSFAAAYKPNMAFFEAFGIDGLRSLEKVIQHVRTNYPDILLIGDGKRGDIGSTSAKYAHAMFNLWDFDAITVNAFSGFDSIEPFLRYSDRGVFVWCKSSNPDGYQFQDLIVSGEYGKKVFEIIAEYCVEWNSSGNLGLVVGATYPEELATVRRIAPELPILVPGVGSQSGDLESSVKFGLATETHGLLISSSRGIIYASDRVSEYGNEAAKACSSLRERINSILIGLDRNFVQ
ncbi:orotidine-5'-phosphate decarboxylase [Chloroflexi bacterium]|nr:orotidine-5'-phosphate decarboxylase [Chloroflexota bacterium]